MARKRYTSKQKLSILLEGLRSNQVKEVCLKHGISSVTYYKWQEKLLDSSERIFSTSEFLEFKRIKKENQKLKSAVGELTLELKKNDW